MTQTMIEHLSTEEYSHFLAYGEPVATSLSTECKAILSKWDHDLYSSATNCKDTDDKVWISTLESTTYPGLTFGYKDVPYMYTVV